ncbi:serine/threonine-protein phosphatase 7-like isoform X1 [Cucurbita moschata]|uniref:Serine/threonine-protein phosphatase n=1 Tax=Cucurbita moschata TaxID=3662 RepID=A0A6J1H8Y4_CUCMO|nr:serine/threonine-protein phosphatase 7-like isoform X1 [Cucurbita moschata]
MDIHVIPQTQIDDGRASVSVLDSVVSSPNNPLIHLRFGGRMEFADEHTAGATTSNSDRHKPSDTRYGVDLSSSDNDTEDAHPVFSNVPASLAPPVSPILPLQSKCNVVIQADMDDKLETIQNICQKIVDTTNLYSFSKLDDHQVYSLMRLREISHRVINDRDSRVTKNDVISAMCFYINRMAGKCKDIVDILNRISYKDLDSQQVQQLLRLKELLCGIVDGAKDVEIEPSHIVEQGIANDMWTTESLEVEPIDSSNDDVLLGDAQIIMVEVEQAVAESRLENEYCDLSHVKHTVSWPPHGCLTLEWVVEMMKTLEQSSRNYSPAEFQLVMPVSVVDEILDMAASILHKEPNCVEIDCHGEVSKVVIVGDIHGHYHDLLHLFELANLPSKSQYYVFNGNYVDRGAWGLEVLLVLLVWKILMPDRVCLLRGNHETRICTSSYGFEKEVRTKYGEQGENVYHRCLETFKELPLAAIIAGKAYTTHGGLFRKPCNPDVQNYEERKTRELEIGSLEDLSKLERFFVDVPTKDEDPNIILADVLWSDPSKVDGLRKNQARGAGLLWGPDVTEAFLKLSNLKLIIRSHEGPDSRDGKIDFDDMIMGYSSDHDRGSGKLYTLFSAPGFPQFGRKSYNNEGAYATLKHPDFEIPTFHTFKAVDKPKIDVCYFGCEGHDVDLDLTLMADAVSSKNSSPIEVHSGVDFEALGILNPPSWSVTMTDDVTGTQSVKIPKAPVVEGLPLPPSIEEPHKAAYEYFLELIAGLKFMLQTTENKDKLPIPHRKRKKCS